MLYTLHDLQTQLSDTALDAAHRLIETGCTIHPSVSRGGELITAVIQTAEARPYRVYVKTHTTATAVEFAGECSCQQRRDCLHIAAVLLQTLADEQRACQTPARSNEQSTGLNAPPAGATEPDTAPDRRLLYVLVADSAPNAAVRINTYAVRTLPNGQYDAAKPYDCTSALRHAAPGRLITADDLALLTTLSKRQRDPRSNALCLSEAEDGPLLKRMLNTGRCHYAQLSTPPLTLSDPRALRFSWQMDEHGYQHPHWTVSPAASQLLFLQPPWYIDADRNECGPLTTALSSETVDTLRSTPPIAPDNANAIPTQLAHQCANGTLPPLRQLPIHQPPAARPIPRLTLISFPRREQDRSGGPHAHRAHLRFEYAGRRLGRNDPATWLDDHRIINIQRDTGFENACAEQLRALGFEPTKAPADDTSGSDSFMLANADHAWPTFLLENAPALRRQGWQIECDDGFAYRLVHGDRWYGDISQSEDREWFNVSIGVEVNGARINLLPALVSAIQAFPDTFQRQHLRNLDHNQPFFLPLEDGRLLPVLFARLRPILETLFELYDSAPLDPHRTLRFRRSQMTRLAELDNRAEDLHLNWSATDDWRQLSERLRGVEHIPAVAPPQGLHAILRPYQQRGLDWLQFLRQYALAGILADDMGLGKTVQTLAHLLLEKERGYAQRPSLVIAPTSLMTNWQREAARFAPALKVLTLHGPQRRAHFKDITRHDLILTTYALLTRDHAILLAHDYHLLILDEAQTIKNTKAQASQLVRQLRAQHRLCLTGTPLENHLGELWSLFDFLLPGLLGNRQQFRQLFRAPIENGNDRYAAKLLARRIRPFMLRRTKDAVATDLPAKTEIVRNVTLEGPQRELYEHIRLAMHERVRQEVARKGLANSHVVILNALLRLRQVCCDPRLVNMENAPQAENSAKLALLMELLTEMIDEGRSVLLFSQFTSMLTLIEHELVAAGLKYVTLTGKTRDRATPVTRFQQRDVPLFLISLKAGGVGLNLTAADTVIHYDPWWNPAVERQATDRAHRIGQDMPVFVYKLISEGTVEEKIHAMQLRKQALADTLYGDQSAAEPQWTEDDLELLFQPLPA